MLRMSGWLFNEMRLFHTFCFSLFFQGLLMEKASSVTLLPYPHLFVQVAGSDTWQKLYSVVQASV